MGSQISKAEQLPCEKNIKETIFAENTPTTPILTPLDPRSPSANIARTPLDAILGSKKIEDSVSELKNETDENNEIVDVVLGIDPRSPTVEFNRTPIIVGTVTKGKSMKLKNKNLENVLKSEIQTTPVASTRKSNIIPPKLLETSPVSIVTNYQKRKSFVGLLETNIDFTETDLDTVCQAKDKLNASLPIEISEDVPYNKLKEQMENLEIQNVTEELIVENIEAKKTENESIEKALDEKVVNVTAQVKDFDKKLSNLIYQDESEDEKIALKPAKIKENNRTPLGIRNLNDDPRKSKNRLKVSDKPRKSDSKIPVFKEYNKKKIQCENTPPMRTEERLQKTKISHWDADKTLVI